VLKELISSKNGPIAMQSARFCFCCVLDLVDSRRSYLSLLGGI
jgi:hypothetical protein